MNLTDRQYIIIKYLKENTTAASSAYLCDEIGISSRTLRYEISNINRSAGCKLIRSNKEGYRLDTDLEIEKIFKNIKLDEYLDLSKEVTLLLLENKEIQTYDIEEACFISQTVVNNIIKQICEPMRKFGLELIKTGPVCKVNGREFDKRRFLLELLFPNNCDLFEEASKKNTYFKSLSILESERIIMEIFCEMEMMPDDVYLKYIIASTAVCLQRFMNGHIEKEKYDDVPLHKDSIAYHFEKELMQRVQNNLDIYLPEEEFQTLLRFHMGAFREESYSKIQEKMILKNPMFETIVRQIVDDTFQHFNINADYEEFFNGLVLHIYYLLLRAKSSSFIKGGLTNSLKHTNPFVYEVSIYMAYLIEGEFNTTIPDEEIGLFAIYIGAVVLGAGELNTTCSAILVCPNYNNLREKLIKQIQSMFYKQIEIVKCVSDYSNIKSDDEYDFIISILGNILTLRNVVIVSPIIGVREFQRVEAMVAVCYEKRMRNDLKGLLLKYLKQNLFFYNEDEADGKEILRFLCGRMKEDNIVDDSFLDLVLKREQMASTAFFNKFAIPHSINADANETKIAFYYREKPINWFGKEVNLVLLLATKGYDKEFVKLYEMLFEMLMNKEMFFKLMRCKTYEELIYFIVNQFDTFN